MAYGTIYKPRWRTRHGAKHLGALTLDNGGAPPISVPQDGPGPYYVPADAADFGELGLAVPNSLWQCQEAAGNLADSLGTGFTLIANGTPLYQQAVPGWTRTASAFNQTAAQRFGVNAGTGPNPAATSVLWLGYMIADTLPGAVRGMINVGGNMGLGLVNASGNLRLYVNAVTVDDATTLPPTDNLVHPFVLQHDLTNSVAALATDEAYTLGTYAAATDGVKGFGAGIFSLSPPALSGVLWGCVYAGTDAELSQAQVRTLLQTLGWTVAW